MALSVIGTLYQQKECMFCHIKHPNSNFPEGRDYCYDCYKYMKKDDFVIDIYDYIKIKPSFKLLRLLALSDREAFSIPIFDLVKTFDVNHPYIYEALEKLANANLLEYKINNKGNKNRTIRSTVDIKLNKTKILKLLNTIQAYVLMESISSIVNVGLE